MNVLEITIQKSYRQRYPVTAYFYQEGSWLAPVRKEGSLILNQHQETSLRAAQLNPVTYGSILGKALFQDNIRDLFMRAFATQLRLLVLVEDPRLKQLRWERLCAPIGPEGDWQMLALSQRVLFASHLPSRVENHFSLIGRRDLRALIVVANPPGDNPYGLTPFAAATVAQHLHDAMSHIPHTFLLTEDKGSEALSVAGLPTLNQVCEQLTNNRYTILHLVAHGAFTQRQTEPVVYLAGDKGQVEPVLATQWRTRLAQLRQLPHLVWLSTCETATVSSDRATGVMEGLAQQMAQDLGLPAVLGMAGRISTETADDLAGRFYPRLWEHGDVNLALREALTPLAQRPDVTVPVLYSRLGRHPLWVDTLDRPLTSEEIGWGLQLLASLIEKRLPGLRGRVTNLIHGLQQYLTGEVERLTPVERQQRERSLHDLDNICQETLEITFQALCVGRTPPPYDVRCPFRGLESFRQEHSVFFCGRENLVETLVAHSQQSPFLAVIGPSGSGKSSLVQAGLLPALQKENPALEPIIIRPGQYPDAALRAKAEAMRSPQAILVVDQFEELFTQCTEEERRQLFIHHLLQLLPERRVILTLREDFLPECHRFPELKGWLAEQRQLIDRMELPDLRRAIEGQAAAVGLRFESDLAQSLVEDVEGEPGAMVLLQMTLQALWDQRHGKWLSVAAYRDLGGVQQVLAHRAEEAYRLLQPVQQEQAQWLLLKLVRPEDTPVPGVRPRDTRLRLPYATLTPAHGQLEEIQRLAHLLADKGLLAISVNEINEQEQVELSHEALIGYWPRLRDWLNEGRTWLALLTRLRENVVLWQNNKQDVSYLWRGRQLAEAKQMIPAGLMAAAEQQFITACEEVEQVEQQKQAKEKRRQKRQKYFRLALAGISLILAGYLLYGYLWTHYPLIPVAPPSLNTLSIQLQSVNLPTAEREQLEQTIANIPMADGSAQALMTIIAQPGTEGMIHLTITLPITPAYRLDFWEEIRTLAGDVRVMGVEDVIAAAAAYSLGDYPEVITLLETEELSELDGISLVLLAQAYLFEGKWEPSQAAFSEAIAVAAAAEATLQANLALAYWRPFLRLGQQGNRYRSENAEQACLGAEKAYKTTRQLAPERDEWLVYQDIAYLFCHLEHLETTWYDTRPSLAVCPAPDAKINAYCDFLNLAYSTIKEPKTDLSHLNITLTADEIHYTYLLLPLIDGLTNSRSEACAWLSHDYRDTLYTPWDRLNYQWVIRLRC